jgi:hypothetical protein
MATQPRTPPGTSVGIDDRSMLALFGEIVSGDRAGVGRRLDSSPLLATSPLHVGASRHDADSYFLAAIRHYVYAGDTALHVAAAAYRRELAVLLMGQGAEVHARNRRGAEPIHYAADGGPQTPHWDPDAQRRLIACLIAAGADPDVRDRSGVAPLHRAVRNRCSAAVSALLEGGADPRLKNRSGSTPLHLAVQGTGKSGSGSPASRHEQARVVAALLRHGATPTDVDARGRSVASAAVGDGVRRLLDPT